MPEQARPPTDILQSIDRKAVKVREAAAVLTQRIEQFENYLSNLNGRVEAHTFVEHPGSTSNFPLELGLALERSGKSWVITCATFCTGIDPDDVEWHPLKEASLIIKVAAVQRFPDLLEAIEKSQDRLVGDIQNAVVRFDAFAATLDPNPNKNQTPAQGAVKPAAPTEKGAIKGY